MKLKLIVAWGYISEIIISSLALYTLTTFFSLSEISKFMHDTASNFASFFSVIMLGGAVAFFWTFYSKSDSDFSQWLYSKGAYNIDLKSL